MTVLDQIKELDAQRATLVQVAKQEFLEVAKNAVSELNKIGKELGFRYVLKEEQTGTASSTSGKAPRTRLSADGIDEVMQVILAKIMSEPDGMRPPSPGVFSIPHHPPATEHGRRATERAVEWPFASLTGLHLPTPVRGPLVRLFGGIAQHQL